MESPQRLKRRHELLSASKSKRSCKVTESSDKIDTNLKEGQETKPDSFLIWRQPLKSRSPLANTCIYSQVQLPPCPAPPAMVDEVQGKAIKTKADDTSGILHSIAPLLWSANGLSELSAGRNTLPRKVAETGKPINCISVSSEINYVGKPKNCDPEVSEPQVSALDKLPAGIFQSSQFSEPVTKEGAHTSSMSEFKTVKTHSKNDLSVCDLKLTPITEVEQTNTAMGNLPRSSGAAALEGSHFNDNNSNREIIQIPSSGDFISCESCNETAMMGGQWKDPAHPETNHIAVPGNNVGLTVECQPSYQDLQRILELPPVPDPQNPMSMPSSSSRTEGCPETFDWCQALAALDGMLQAPTDPWQEVPVKFCLSEDLKTMRAEVQAGCWPVMLSAADLEQGNCTQAGFPGGSNMGPGPCPFSSSLGHQNGHDNLSIKSCAPPMTGIAGHRFQSPEAPLQPLDRPLWEVLPETAALVSSSGLDCCCPDPPLDLHGQCLEWHDVPVVMCPDGYVFPA